MSIDVLERPEIGYNVINLIVMATSSSFLYNNENLNAVSCCLTSWSLGNYIDH